LASVRDAIQLLGYVLKEVELIKEPKLYKELNPENLDRVREALERFEDNDDVQNVWSDVQL